MGQFDRIIRNPYELFFYFKKHINLGFLSDKTYISLHYRASMGKKINWKNPKTYNEKLQWLKLYDHNPLYTTLVDKYAVKKYVADRIGEKFVIPTLGVWNHFDDIDFDALPDQFVLKCTHDSGGLVIVTDKANFDVVATKRKIEDALGSDFYKTCREWPYKNVTPRIIAEQYMLDDRLGELKDYKFFCFSGTPKYLFVASDRNKGKQEVKFDYFDINFKRLPLRQAAHPNSTYHIERPQKYDEMLRIATELSKGIPQVRIDLYEVNGRVYFGEYTFFHHGGMVPFIPEEWDYRFGELICLPEKNR